MSPIAIRRLDARATLPTRATPGAAGYDLSALLDAPVTLAPGGRALIPTGIAIHLANPSLCALIYARSGLACKSGIALANGVGVVDSDYQGQIQVALINLSDTSFTVESGMRIAQLVIASVHHAPFVEVSSFIQETERGCGGFGHTGGF